MHVNADIWSGAAMRLDRQVTEAARRKANSSAGEAKGKEHQGKAVNKLAEVVEDGHISPF
jgi:hypothetical protein